MCSAPQVRAPTPSRARRNITASKCHKTAASIHARLGDWVARRAGNHEVSRKNRGKTMDRLKEQSKAAIRFDHGRSPGFTLIEILVVIAIDVNLAFMLLT